MRYRIKCQIDFVRAYMGVVLCKLPVPGRPNQGPTALAVGAGGGCLDIFFSRLSFLFSFFLSLGDDRYRL